MRIRWRRVARVAAVFVVGLIAVRVVPGLLRAPEPPPLGADVGLPKAASAPAEPVHEVMKEPAKQHKGKAAPSRDERRSRQAPVGADAPAATAVVGSRGRHRDRRARDRRPHRRNRGDSAPAPPEPTSPPVESSPPPTPEYVPPPVTEPSPAPLPEPTPEPPPTPGDGSEEFAPH